MLARKNFQRFSYPKDMDLEMVDFMDVLNNIPGCRTLFCCQGHGYGGWYFVANCCNEVPYKAIDAFFSKKKQVNSEIKVVIDGFAATGCPVPEYRIVVYDKAFDKQTDAQKKHAYREMCEHFLEFVPGKHWH